MMNKRVLYLFFLLFVLGMLSIFIIPLVSAKEAGPICTPVCICAATTCVGTTCADGCGGTCAGTYNPGCVPFCIGSSYTNACNAFCYGTVDCGGHTCSECSTQACADDAGCALFCSQACSGTVSQQYCQEVLSRQCEVGLYNTVFACEWAERQGVGNVACDLGGCGDCLSVNFKAPECSGNILITYTTSFISMQSSMTEQTPSYTTCSGNTPICSMGPNNNYGRCVQCTAVSQCTASNFCSANTMHYISPTCSSSLTCGTIETGTSPCPAGADTQCTQGVCASGTTCGVGNKNPGTPCTGATSGTTYCNPSYTNRVYTYNWGCNSGTCQDAGATDTYTACASDQCNNGICSNGACTKQPKIDGTTCTINSAAGTCQSGTCTPTDPCQTSCASCTTKPKCDEAKPNNLQCDWDTSTNTCFTRTSDCILGQTGGYSYCCIQIGGSFVTTTFIATPY